jgi:hypothetical protein
MRKAIVMTLCLVGISLHSGAQKTNYYELYKEKYKGENRIVLNDHKEVRIKLVKGELNIKTVTKEEYLILDDKPMPTLEQSVQYNGFVPLTYLKAETLIPTEKGGYTRKKVTDFYDVDQLSYAIFHDDTRATHFEFSGIEQGAITRKEYGNHLKEPRFLGPFIFANYMPVVNSTYTIYYPPTVELIHKEYNLEGYNIKFEEGKEGKMKYLKWTATEIPKFAYERDAPSGQYFMPHVVCFIKSFKNKSGEQEKLLGGVDDLHNWYTELIQEYDTGACVVDLAGIVDSITSEATTDLEKVKEVYYWVQDHIKYIAFEDGMHGFVPRPGNSIYSNRYGDCKDMASIINKMLDHIDIEAHLVWIGTRDIPYKYTDVPTPSSDNHMIAAYKIQDSIIYLDATASYLPFGLPTPFIQGKQALVHNADESYDLKNVPVTPAAKNYRKDTTIINIENGKIKGEGLSAFGGYNRMMIVMYTGFSKKKDKEDFYKELLAKGNNNCIVSDMDETNLENKDTTLNVKYSFVLGDYIHKSGDEVYLNMNLEKSEVPNLIKKKRTVPVEFDFKESGDYTVVLNVPEGYEVKFLPKNRSHNEKYLSYDISYKQAGEELVYNFNIKKKSLMLRPEEFAAYNKELKMLQADFRKSVILKKISN